MSESQSEPTEPTLFLGVDDGSTPPDPLTFIYDGLEWVRADRICYGKKRKSNVWTAGSLYHAQEDKLQEIFRCRLCVKTTVIKVGRYSSTTAIWQHLRGVHRLMPDDEHSVRSISTDRSIGAALSVHQNLTHRVNIDRLRTLILRWILCDHIAFNAIESERFIAVLEMLSPGIEKHIGGRITLRRWLDQEFDRAKLQLKSLLAISLSKIHLSFDLWTSPNQLAIVGVVAHWVGDDYQCKSALIGMQKITTSHSGDNIAAVIVPIIYDYEIQARIGVFIADNVESNDTAIRAILQCIEPDFTNIASRRSRCLGHIINLAAKAFLFGNDIEAFQQTEDGDEIAKDAVTMQKEQELWRRKGAIGKVHNIAVYIRSSPQRKERFKRCFGEKDEDQDITVMLDNSTRWNSTYLSLERALRLRSRIAYFCIEQPDLRHDTLTEEQWEELQLVYQGLEPFYQMTLHCQGQGQQGHHGSIWEALPVLEILLQHTEDGRQMYQGSDRLNPLSIAYQNAWEKLTKYYSKTDHSYEIYAAAALLNPALRIEYFNDHWLGSSAEYIEKMVSTVRSRWEADYKQNAIEETHLPTLNVLHSFLQKNKKSITPTAVPAAKSTARSAPRSAAKSAAKTAPISTPRSNDQFDKYVYSPPIPLQRTEDMNLLQWWSTCDYPDLKQMAFDTLSIPAMSAEIERCFSSAKLLLRPHRNRMSGHTIEMAELMHDWLLKKHINI